MDDKVKAAVTDDISNIIKSAVSPVTAAMKKELDNQVEIMKKYNEVMRKYRENFQNEKYQFFTQYGNAEKLFWIGLVCAVVTPVLLGVLLVAYFV